MDSVTLDMVFGQGSKGDTVEERARTSTRKWVRSQDHLSEMSECATGLVMTSEEVLEIFGIEVMLEALERCTAIITIGKDEPCGSIKRRREKKELTHQDLAERTGFSLEEIQDAEDPETRTPMHILGMICDELDIDVRRISFERFE